MYLKSFFKFFIVFVFGLMRVLSFFIVRIDVVVKMFFIVSSFTSSFLSFFLIFLCGSFLILFIIIYMGVKDLLLILNCVNIFCNSFREFILMFTSAFVIFIFLKNVVMVVNNFVFVFILFMLMMFIFY